MSKRSVGDGQRTLVVILILALVAGVQILAFARQFALGFRPLVSAPVRVPFSWDMFANRVERCVVTWDSPLQIGSRRLNRLHDIQLGFEWDIIFDRVADYRLVAGDLCLSSTGTPFANRARLHCFLPEGMEIDDDFTCN